jgi:translation elongation factor EF-1beta
MAKVAVLFNVYPKDGTTPEKAMDNIKSSTNPAGMQLEEVAFGIKVIKVMYKFDDAETSSSKFEDKLKAVEGVGELEVAEEGLL